MDPKVNSKLNEYYQAGFHPEEISRRYFGNILGQGKKSSQMRHRPTGLDDLFTPDEVKLVVYQEGHTPARPKMDGKPAKPTRRTAFEAGMNTYGALRDIPRLAMRGAGHVARAAGKDELGDSLARGGDEWSKLTHGMERSALRGVPKTAAGVSNQVSALMRQAENVTGGDYLPDRKMESVGGYFNELTKRQGLARSTELSSKGGFFNQEGAWDKARYLGETLPEVGTQMATAWGVSGGNPLAFGAIMGSADAGGDLQGRRDELVGMGHDPETAMDIATREANAYLPASIALEALGGKILGGTGTTALGRKAAAAIFPTRSALGRAGRQAVQYGVGGTVRGAGEALTEGAQTEAQFLSQDIVGAGAAPGTDRNAQRKEAWLIGFLSGKAFNAGTQATGINDAGYRAERAAMAAQPSMSDSDILDQLERDEMMLHSPEPSIDLLHEDKWDEFAEVAGREQDAAKIDGLFDDIRAERELERRAHEAEWEAFGKDADLFLQEQEEQDAIKSMDLLESELDAKDQDQARALEEQRKRDEDFNSYKQSLVDQNRKAIADRDAKLEAEREQAEHKQKTDAEWEAYLQTRRAELDAARAAQESAPVDTETDVAPLKPAKVDPPAMAQQNAGLPKGQKPRAVPDSVSSLHQHIVSGGELDQGTVHTLERILMRAGWMIQKNARRGKKSPEEIINFVNDVLDVGRSSGAPEISPQMIANMVEAGANEHDMALSEYMKARRSLDQGAIDQRKYLRAASKYKSGMETLTGPTPEPGRGTPRTNTVNKATTMAGPAKYSADDPGTSPAPRPRNTYSREQERIRLKRMLNRLKAVNYRASDIEVVDTADALPEALQPKDGAVVEAVTDPSTGRAYFVADAIIDKGLKNDGRVSRRAMQLWFHEQGIHNGLRGVLGDGSGTFLRSLLKTVGKKQMLSDLPTTYHKMRDLDLAEEWFARYAEMAAFDPNMQVDERGVLQRFKDALRGKIRVAFKNIKLTESEMDNMVRSALQWTRGRNDVVLAVNPNSQDEPIKSVRKKKLNPVEVRRLRDERIKRQQINASIQSVEDVTGEDYNGPDNSSGSVTRHALRRMERTHRAELRKSITDALENRRLSDKARVKILEQAIRSPREYGLGKVRIDEKRMGYYMGQFKQLFNAKRDETRNLKLSNIITRLNSEIDAQYKTALLSRIEVLLDPKTGIKKDSRGIQVGKIPEPVRKELASIREIAMMPTDQAQAIINDIASTLDSENPPQGESYDELVMKLSRLTTFYGMQERDIAQLEIAVEWLDDMMKTGKKRIKMKSEIRRAEMRKLADQVIDVASNGEGVPTGAANVQDAVNQKSKPPKIWETVGYHSIPSLLQKIVKKTGRATGASRLVPVIEHLTGRLQDATTNFGLSLIEFKDMRVKALEKIYKKTHGTLFKNLELSMLKDRKVSTETGVYQYETDAEVQERLGLDGIEDDALLDLAIELFGPEYDITTMDRKGIIQDIIASAERIQGDEIPLSQEQSATMWATLSDPLNQDKLGSWGFTAETMQQLDSFMSDQTKAAARFYVNDYLPKILKKVNPVYGRMFDYQIPEREGYFPLSVQHFGEDQTDPLLRSQPQFASTKPGNLIARVAHGRPPEFKNISDVMQRYESNMLYFSAFGEAMMEARSVLGRSSVRQTIQKHAGVDIDRELQFNLNDLASMGRTMNDAPKFAEKINSMVAAAQLPMKPLLALKQMTSFVGFMHRMPAHKFVYYQAKFMAKAAKEGGLKWFYDANPILKVRKEQGHDRDFASMLKAVENHNLTFANVPAAVVWPLAWAAKKGSWFTRAGDMAAIISGGGAYYMYELESTGSPKKAALRLSRATNEMQQTQQRMDQGRMQASTGGSRVLTLFRTAQIGLARNLVSLKDDMIAGRISPAEASRGAMTIGLMYSLFEAARSGFFIDDEDDIKDIALAGAIDPITSWNPFTEVMGGVAKARIKGEKVPFYGSTLSLPAVDAANTVGRAGSDISDISQGEEMTEAKFKHILQASGYVASFPADGLYRWYQGIDEVMNDPDDNPYINALKLLGMNDYQIDED